MIKLIPEPSKIELVEGVFTVSEFTQIKNNNYCVDSVDVMITFFKDRYNLDLKTCEGYSPNIISFDLINDEDFSDEQYVLEISELAVSIKGKTEQAIFYGVQTFWQLALQYGTQLPYMKITDKPRFEYRGFMLDVGRYFYTVAEVKKILSICARLKLNVFHWHLTEDQGWRVEIKKYPRLTEVGSKRSHTNFNHRPHGGFYTQEEIREVVAYAHARHIKVYPEIDMPGHMVSALASYPELGCFDRKLKVATHWGVKHDILCAGKPKVFEFVKDVLTEIMEMFPDGIIHLGADEAVKTRWNICPRCQKRIKDLGLKDSNELQSHFINEVAKFLKSKGFDSAIWNEEHPSGLNDKSVIWQYYMADGDPTAPPKYNKMMADEINTGRRIINAQSNAYYFDLPYNTISLKQSYEYEPMIAGIEKPENLLGVEACLWTEYVPNMEKAMKMSFPRLFAMAESAWSEPEKKNYNRFLDKLPFAEQSMYGNYGIEGASWKVANPSKARGFFEQKWFNRRIFHWQGLHNLIDNAKVARLAKKLEKKALKAKKDK